MLISFSNLNLADMCDAAFDLAGRFVLQRRSSGLSRWLNLDIQSRAKPKIFWWAGKIPLVEVPFLDSSSRQRRGYALISTNEGLPPILQYATRGACLSDQIIHYMRGAVPQSLLRATESRFIYMSPTSIHVETMDEESGGFVSVGVPGLATFRHSAPLEEYFPQPTSFVEAALGATANSNRRRLYSGLVEVADVINESLAPVLYNQNCDKLSALCSAAIQNTPSYCANAISGCVPVAWAMMLSSLKKMGVPPLERIWEGVEFWDFDWPSWIDPNPAICPEVEKTIWHLHQIMGTSPGGATDWSNIIKGKAVLADFNAEVSIKEDPGPRFDEIINLVGRGCPFIWAAEGHWLDYGVVSESAGHAVVVFGCNAAERTLHVGLGWGDGSPAVDIPWDQFQHSRLYYHPPA